MRNLEKSVGPQKKKEAGHSVPSSQDLVTRGVQNLHISDPPAAGAALPAPPPSTMRNSRRPPRPKQQPREYLRCAQCGPDPAVHTASTDQGLMRQMGQKHGGQQPVPRKRWATAPSAACVVFGTVRTFHAMEQCSNTTMPPGGGDVQDGSDVPCCPGCSHVLMKGKKLERGSTRTRHSGKAAGTSTWTSVTMLPLPAKVVAAVVRLPCYHIALRTD